MDAREYLDTVRAAQRGIDRRLAVIESMRAREQVRAQRYDAVGKGAHGTDFMRSTDDRHRLRAPQRSRTVGASARGGERARAVRGRALGQPRQALGRRAGCATARTAPCRRSRGRSGVSVRSVNSDLCAALDWTDMVGMAAARSGLGRAAV